MEEKKLKNSGNKNKLRFITFFLDVMLFDLLY